ncbi:MAG: phosphohydrolase [Akkermansiaceae bacterium]|nr:phosphohydrolase [Akkermansiaceae bacterium]
MHSRILFPAGFLALSFLPTANAVEFGHVVVVQKTAANTAAAVTLSIGPGSSPGFTLVGGNRGDYDINLDYSSGALISSVTEIGRSNKATGDTFDTFYATSAWDKASANNKSTLAIFRAAQGDEANINASAAWFPYTEWYAGLAKNSAGTNGGANDSFTGSPGLTLGTHFIDEGGGISTLDLREFQGTPDQGVLLVTGAKNEDNYALSKPNPDGTFTIYCKDNGTNTSTYEQDYVGFAYVPLAKVGTGNLVAAARINGNGTTDTGAGSFSMVKSPNTGEWHLTIPGYTHADGVLVISPSGGTGNNLDNIVAYQWDAANGYWIIESRDLSDAATLPTRQNMANAEEDAFSFAFFSNVPANTVPPTVSLDSPLNGSRHDMGEDILLAASAADADGSIARVQFYSGATLLGERTAPPYEWTIPAPPLGTYTYSAVAIDNTGSVKTSTPVNVQVAPPAGSGGMFFDGVDDYVTFGDSPDLKLAAFTLECWFKREGTGVAASTGSGGISAIPLITKGRGESDGSPVDCNYFMGIRGSDNVIAADFEDYATGLNHPVAGNTPIKPGIWYHAAVTFDGNEWRIYLNGKLETVAETDGQIPRFDSIQHAGLGTAMNSLGEPSGYFLGFMDEARIWNYARSESEIAGSMNLEVPSAGGLVGRWGMDEGVGTSVGTAVAGVLTNGPLWAGGYTDFDHNILPSVTLDAPLSGTVATVGDALTLSATPADTDGTVTKVEFYDGGQKLGEALTPPYSITWTAAGLSDHSITARATDDKGGSSASTVATVTVHPVAGQGGLYFDGLNDRVTFGQAPELGLPEFTLECWFKREDGGLPAGSGSGGITAIPLIAKGRGENDNNTLNCNYLFGIRASDGVLCADFEEGPAGASPGLNHPVAGTTAVPVGVWTHAAATYDGTTWRLYLNGHLEAELNVGQPPASNSIQHAGIGTAMDSTATPQGAFHGVMDEVRIWNRARTLSELRTSMNSEVPTANGLVARYAMDEASGNTITSTAAVALPGTLLDGVFRTAGAPLTGDVPPSITTVSPAAGATGQTATTSLVTNVTDPDSQKLTVKYYGRRIGTGAPGEDFSLAVIPDTQYYSAEKNGGKASFFSAQTDWIIQETTPRNIRFTMHMGDISDDGDAYEFEWLNAKDAMYRLEDPALTLSPSGLPYSVAIGNHDQTPNGNPDGTSLYFNKYFGVNPADNTNHFAGKPYYGGTQFQENADNNFTLFEAGGIQFVVLSLEYDASPDQIDLDWADSILKAYPTRRAIVVSHHMVNTGNPATFSPMGKALYDRLKNNPNLFIMHGGHIHGEGRRTDVWNGRPVTSILADYQGRNRGGDGWMRLMEFSPKNNQIHVKTYSPVLGQWETDADSDYLLDVDLQSALASFAEIGRSEDVAAGTNTAIDWANLDPGTVYEWYAEVSDGTTSIRGDIQRFTTAAAPVAPAVTLDSPVNGASFTEGAPVDLAATASDADGSIAKVEFYNGTEKIGEDDAAPYEFTWNGATAGSHLILAKAIDNAGLVTTSEAATISVIAAKPKVTVIASDAIAGEFGEDKTLVYTFERTGSITAALEVPFTLGGTATSGVDFTAVSGTVTIAAGEANAQVTFTVVPDDAAEGNETLTVSIAGSEIFDAGNPASATATIADRPSQAWTHDQLVDTTLTGPSDDADHDGFANLLEYYMKTLPGDNASRGVFLALPSESGLMKVRYQRGKDVADATGTLQWSSDLVTWHASGESDGTATVTITEQIVSAADENPEMVESTLNLSTGAAPAGIYVRLSVE